MLSAWKHAKSTAVLAALALALGIGSVTAIFTIVRSVLLRPLVYPDSDRVVRSSSLTAQVTTNLLPGLGIPA